MTRTVDATRSRSWGFPTCRICSLTTPRGLVTLENGALTRESPSCRSGFITYSVYMLRMHLYIDKYTYCNYRSTYDVDGRFIPGSPRPKLVSFSNTLSHYWNSALSGISLCVWKASACSFDGCLFFFFFFFFDGLDSLDHLHFSPFSPYFFLFSHSHTLSLFFFSFFFFSPFSYSSLLSLLRTECSLHT
jgi:hypothetical protein